MKILKYYTVRTTDSPTEAIRSIEQEQGKNAFFALSPPYSLAGNARVLVLHRKSNHNEIVKVDGPGWIIEDLYKKFAGLA